MEDGIEKSFEEQEGSSDEEKEEKEEGEGEEEKEEVTFNSMLFQLVTKHCSGSHSRPSVIPSQQ